MIFRAAVPVLYTRWYKLAGFVHFKVQVAGTRLRATVSGVCVPIAFALSFTNRGKCTILRGLLGVVIIHLGACFFRKIFEKNFIVRIFLRVLGLGVCPPGHTGPPDIMPDIIYLGHFDTGRLYRILTWVRPNYGRWPVARRVP